MMNNKLNKIENIQNCIFNIRNQQVMVDSDLAENYGVETKVLNQAVKRNINRFPKMFRFQLTADEMNLLRSQPVTSNKHGGRRYLPYVFTEQGVAMLSAVLRSETAVKISIQIMQAFVEMKKFIADNTGVFQRLDKIEQKQVIADENFDKIFKALENKSLPPKQGVFFNGHVFDAYTLVSDLIRTATKKLTTAHDRFLIIDRQTVYHFGASLKDLGKKWFAFSKLTINANDILEKL